LTTNRSRPIALPPNPDALMRNFDSMRLEAQQGGNVFNLRISPKDFVNILQSSGRSDLSSAIFLKLLDAYLQHESMDEDPLT